jgi:polar amino acid transport system substrate-binding protein
MRATIRNILLFCLLSGSATAATVDDIIFMTEQYPPYNQMNDNKIQGIAVDVLAAMLKRAKSNLTRENIEMLPWARGYKRVQNEPNTSLFSTTRTEERESLFKWVGPIAPNIVGLIARKDKNIKIASVQDMKKYQIGVIRDDVGEQILVKAGISIDTLERVADTKQNIKKLNRGRIDLIAYGVNVALWEIKSMGLNPEEFETVYSLSSGQLYFAFHIDTENSIIQKLQNVLDELKSDGEYQKIMDQYVK